MIKTLREMQDKSSSKAVTWARYAPVGSYAVIPWNYERDHKRGENIRKVLIRTAGQFIRFEPLSARKLLESNGVKVKEF